MPRTNIYIRNEDYATWKAIENKPDLIHEALVNRALFDAADGGMVFKPKVSTFKSGKDVVAKIQKEKEIKTCAKHGFAIDLCKYGCVR